MRAAAPEAPLEIALEVDLGAAGPPSSVSVRASVDTASTGSVRIVLEGVDLGDGTPVRTELDALRLGPEAIRAIEALVLARIADIPATTPALQRLKDHLPGALGLDPLLPPLPLDALIADPLALRGWLADLAAEPGALRRWFTHVAGLAGAAAAPVVTGSGTPDEPLATTLVELGGGSALRLVGAAGPVAGSDVPALTVGIELEIATSRAAASTARSCSCASRSPGRCPRRCCRAQS